MSETRDLMQRTIAVLWEAARSLGTDAEAMHQMAGLIEALAETEAQLAGLRLHLLNEARLAGNDAAIADVRQSVRTTPHQATAALKLAADVGERFPLIGSALQDATISLAQAEAIVAGMRKLPLRLTRAELEQCQESILAHAQNLGPTELRSLAARLVEVVDPEHVEADEAKRLAAEERAAHRNRFLRLAPDFHGSVRITGQLPVAEAELLRAQLEALMPSISSYAENGEKPTPDARRADALVLLTQAAANAEVLPGRGGDRPTVHITMSYESLVSGAGKVGLFGGQDCLDGISAGAARQLACQAGVIPRGVRPTTPCLGGPGGRSDAGNGVLLCPYHHRLVEPDPLQPSGSQWEVYLHPVTGLPWLIPPQHIDPKRRPRQHARFVLQSIDLPGTASPCPPEKPLNLDELASPAWISDA